MKVQNHPEVFYITVKVNTDSGALATILQIASCIKGELFRFLSMPYPKVLQTLIQKPHGLGRVDSASRVRALYASINSRIGQRFNFTWNSNGRNPLTHTNPAHS